MRMLVKNRRVFFIVAIIVGLTTVGCLGGFIEVGPVRFTADVGEGTILPSIVVLKGAPPVSYREDLCNIPSESELEERFLQVGGVDISNFIRLSGLNIIETKLTATSGDFNFLSALTIRYIPAPENGQEQDPIILGTATNDNGLGIEVNLVAPEPIDFLDLIQQNDENPSSECPELEVEMTPRTLITQNVEYAIAVTVDAYAEVGKF
jgi:hypothetical protein